MAEDSSAHLQEINEEIYKRNVELAVVNKTLSLLRKLYEISLLALDPASLSEKISETVQVDLNMEAVGIFLYEKEKDLLQPFQFSLSERMAGAAAKVGLIFGDLIIQGASSKKVVGPVVATKASGMTSELAEVWSDPKYAPKLSLITKESHLKTVLLYPLQNQDRVIGMLFLGLNRDYKLLNQFEKDAIGSFINVIAVALDKALVYEKLKVLNEQLKILDKARADFITIASHQLRTPPATIKWYLSAILSGDYGDVPASIKDQLQKAEVTNNSLISLIDDLLNASRIERGKMEFLFTETDLEEITQLTVDQLTPLAGMKKLELIYHKPTETYPKIMADKEKLRQVINNFIDNAIKYTKEGKVVVDLQQQDDSLIVAVSDSGKGMSEEEKESLFGKYTRGKDAMTHSSGLGLGLYVGKIIIGQHKGKIWAESLGEGKGSTFAFSIPIHNDLKENSIVNLAAQAD